MTPEEIGNALKTRRKEYQLRQEEVAEFARVSERFVREVEKGKHTVRLDKLIDVLTAVGLELVATDRVPEQLKPFKGWRSYRSRVRAVCLKAPVFQFRRLFGTVPLAKPPTSYLFMLASQTSLDQLAARHAAVKPQLVGRSPSLAPAQGIR